jgi:hypothetical protein
MVNFVLDYLNSTITLDASATIFAEPAVALDVSAVAVFEISLADMTDMFKYQTDSNDVIDLSSTDIKYYVDQSLWPELNPANAMMDHASSSGRIADNGSSGDPLASNKQLVCHDYVRYLALKLFNTHFGVDLFQNELEMLADIRTNCGSGASGNTWFDVTEKVIAVGLQGTHEFIEGPDDVGAYMTNDTTDNSNLCRMLMTQMLSAAPTRFADIVDISDDGNAKSLPFEENDSISFKLIIQAHPEQHNATGVDAIGNRSYEIKLILKETPANTAVAEDEAV